jgi:hypothetical protein
MKEVEKFYDWLLKCKNVYLSDNNKINNSFLIVLKNGKQ